MPDYEINHFDKVAQAILNVGNPKFGTVFTLCKDKVDPLREMYAVLEIEQRNDCRDLLISKESFYINYKLNEEDHTNPHEIIYEACFSNETFPISQDAMLKVIRAANILNQCITKTAKVAQAILNVAKPEYQSAVKACKATIKPLIDMHASLKKQYESHQTYFESDEFASILPSDMARLIHATDKLNRYIAKEETANFVKIEAAAAEQINFEGWVRSPANSVINLLQNRLNAEKVRDFASGSSEANINTSISARSKLQVYTAR